MTDKSEAIFMAGRLFSQGQGEESNPYAYETEARNVFDDEMERLELEEQKREAQQL
jgi:hypothetical protein